MLIDTLTGFLGLACAGFGKVALCSYQSANAATLAASARLSNRISRQLRGERKGEVGGINRAGLHSRWCSCHEGTPYLG